MLKSTTLSVPHWHPNRDLAHIHIMLLVCFYWNRKTDFAMCLLMLHRSLFPHTFRLVGILHRRECNRPRVLSHGFCTLYTSVESLSTLNVITSRTFLLFWLWIKLFPANPAYNWPILTTQISGEIRREGCPIYMPFNWIQVVFPESCLTLHAPWDSAYFTLVLQGLTFRLLFPRKGNQIHRGISRDSQFFPTNLHQF